MPRPLQNRVTPDGTIEAHPARGLWMGNRGGRFHRPDQSLGRRRHASRAWIYCVLSFKERQRQVMGQGYTELFFLDEATALAAGHRPCFECQRTRADSFATLWAGGPPRARADAMDRVLHPARQGPVWRAMPGALPDGTMVEWQGTPHLLHARHLLRWGHSGYETAVSLPKMEVEVLTPAPIVRVIAAGFSVSIHPSAAALF
ncbi:MAG: hypothetical protein AAGE18_18465 [Pseudomonadota bacterium]